MVAERRQMESELWASSATEVIPGGSTTHQEFAEGQGRVSLEDGLRARPLFLIFTKYRRKFSC